MPTYTYTANTPQAADPMNVTQPLILENFKAIPELITINHVGFNVDNFGTHNVLALQQQSVPTTTATEIDLFCKVTGSPNPAELYIVYPQGAATTTPVLVSVPYDDTATGTSNVGYVSFPSGIKLSYGTVVASLTSGTAIINTPQYTQNSQAVNATAITVNSGWVNAFGLSSGTSGTTGLWIITGLKESAGTTTYNYLAMGI